MNIGNPGTLPAHLSSLGYTYYNILAYLKYDAI